MCGVVDGFFCGGGNVVGGAVEHHFRCVEVSLEDDFTAEEAFYFGEVTVAHWGDFEGVDDGEIGFLGHNFDELRFGTAGVHLGREAGFCCKVDSAFDCGECELAEDIDGLEDECSRAAYAEEVGFDWHCHNVLESFLDIFDKSVGPVIMEFGVVVVGEDILLGAEDAGVSEPDADESLVTHKFFETSDSGRPHIDGLNAFEGLEFLGDIGQAGAGGGNPFGGWVGYVIDGDLRLPEAFAVFDA